MTDREKIAEILGWPCVGWGVSSAAMEEEDWEHISAVERLIRDAAERAWEAGCEEGEEAALEHATEYAGREPKAFPADFPLVAPKEVDR